MKVFVYRNLTKKCWSVKALSGPNKGRVIGHLDSLVLQDCEFRISEAGRQRVLREGKKYVHAGVVGTLLAGTEKDIGYKSEAFIAYNPRKYDSFVQKTFDVPNFTVKYSPIREAEYVSLRKDGFVTKGGSVNA